MEKNASKTYKLTAALVLFCVDRSIISIDPPEGLQYRISSFVRNQDFFEKYFSLSDFEIRRAYETAKIDDDLHVITLEYEYQSKVEVGEDIQVFNRRLQDEAWENIDQFIRKLRFIKEAPVHYKEIGFFADVTDDRQTNKEYISSYTFTGRVYSPDKLLPIYMGDILDYKNLLYHFDESDKEEFEKIREIHFPLSDKQLNTAYALYDLSYTLHYHVAVIVLMSALEIIYLKGEQNKGELISKRCAVNLCDNHNDVKSMMKSVKQLYKKRSDFVHDGKMNIGLNVNL